MLNFLIPVVVIVAFVLLLKGHFIIAIGLYFVALALVVKLNMDFWKPKRDARQPRIADEA